MNLGDPANKSLSFNVSGLVRLLLRLWFIGLIIWTGCGPKEDPELVRERQIVSQGIEILRSGTAVQRDSVIRTFYNLKHPEFFQNFLNDPDPNVRIGMVSAIGYHKDKSAAAALNSLLSQVDDYLLRETIIYAIGELCDTSSVPILIGFLKDTSVKRDLRLGIPITLASFIKTEAAAQVEQAFAEILTEQGDDIELCSYVAVGILESLQPRNVELFREYLPLLRQMAEKRKEEAGEDGIWTNLELTVQELEKYESPSS